jgi:hypothetical protein
MIPRVRRKLVLGTVNGTLSDLLTRWLAVLALLSAGISGCAVPEPTPVPDGVEPQIVNAALVEANTCLFRYGRCSAPALVVFSLDPGLPFRELRKLAKLTYSTKGTPPATDDLKVLAKPFTDETYRGDAFLKVPDSLGYGSMAYIAPVWVERKKLDLGYLSGNMALRLNVYVIDGAPSTTRLLGVAPYTVDQ